MLEEQINGFIEYCKVSGFRDKSIESLSIRLNQFKKFLKTARLRKIKSITYRHLSRFVADYKNPSIHVKKARIWSLRQFFHYLKLNGYVNENIATDLPYPKIEKTVPISKKVALKLLRSVDQSTWHGKRNFSVISMLWALGLRISELTSLKVKSFEPDHDPENRIGLLRVRGKNKKQRALFVVDKLYDVLTDYLNHSESPKKKNAPLFPIQSGKAISNNRVLKMIKEYSVRRDILKY